MDEAHAALCGSGWADLSRQEIQEFVDELTSSWLVYAEGGRYLSRIALALA